MTEAPVSSRSYQFVVPFVYLLFYPTAFFSSQNASPNVSFIYYCYFFFLQVRAHILESYNLRIYKKYEKKIQ